MFMIMGTFGLVVFMLIIGFIGETVSSMFSSSEESESVMSEEIYTEYATAH
jgi:hypothetical protein